MKTTTPRQSLGICSRFLQQGNYTYEYEGATLSTFVNLGFNGWHLVNLQEQEGSLIAASVLVEPEAVPPGFERCMPELARASEDRLKLIADFGLGWSSQCDPAELRTFNQVSDFLEWMSRETMMAEGILARFERTGRVPSPYSLMGFGKGSEFKNAC